MKTTLKRVLSMALALVLLVGVLPMAALAAEKNHPGECASWKGDCQCDMRSDFGPNSVQCPVYLSSARDDHHNMQESAARQEPTCMVAGHEATMTCANGCGKTTGGTTIPALGATSETGHNMQQTAARQEPTCVNEGREAVMTCSNGCGKTTGGEAIPATGNHDFSNNAPVCQSCGAENPDYEEPEVIPAVLVIWENGIEKYRADCTPSSNVSIADCLACGEINGDHVTKIAINGTEVETSVNGSFVLGAAGTTTTINFTTVTNPGTGSGSDSGNGTGSGSNAGNGSGSGTTTTPNKYNVYYNVNVDETSKVNNPFGTYEEGTRLSTIVQTLKAMEGSTIKFPGLFETWFAVEGWYVDGIKVTDVDTRILTGNTVFYAKWYQKYNYEVVLKLYTNGNTNNVVKVIDAFKYVQDDGRLSHTEVTNIAKEYIEPNNDAGLTVYGPFDANGWEQYSLYSNRLTNTEYVTVNRNGTTVVHAMVHNAKIYNSTSSTNKKADSSNPKTGDMIMMPAAVMSVSVSALAVMFYLKKKRTV